MNANQRFLASLLTAVFIVLIFLLGRSCAKPAEIHTGINVDSLKTEIAKEYKQREKLLRKAHEADTVRIKYLVRWKEVKKEIKDLPCDSAIKIVIQTCDTIILKDSVLISDLKNVIRVDSLMIGNYEKVVVYDSLTIVGLKKEVRRQKRKKWLAWGFAVLFGTVAVVK